MLSRLSDTGCRVKEVLGLRFSDLDLDAMVLGVLGKGRRERLVPFSPELRRVLFRWVQRRYQLFL